MRHRFWAGALILVGVISIGVGIVHGGRRHHDRRERFEEHVAELCVDAARRVDDDRPWGPPRGWRHRRGAGSAPAAPPPVAPGPVAPAEAQPQ